MRFNNMMKKYQPLWVTIILITFSFSIMVLGNPVIAAQNGARISGSPTDYGSDSDNDGNFDLLTVEVTINVTVSGKYTLYGTMIESGLLLNSKSEDYFEKGPHTIYLDFDGNEIYKSGVSGPYKILISLYNKNLIEDLSYETKSYSFEDFNPNPPVEPESGTSLVVHNNTVILQTSIFVAMIYEQKPEITFYYTIDEGESAKFTVAYPKVIGFNDKNENGKYDGSDEFVCQADFYKVVWTSTKTLMESFESFDFEITATMDLLDSNNGLVSPITVSFHYSSLTTLPQNIDAARKFDIELQLYEPVDEVTHFAIDHELSDETGDHSFNLVQTSFGPKISFEDKEGKEHGYYLWKSSVSVGHNGDMHEEQVGYSYNDDGVSHIELLLIYPYQSEYRTILHDPVVGVNPENQPELPGPAEEVIIQHQILLYILAFCIGGAIIIGSIYLQRKHRD
jgi:hypothetical protein